MAKKRAADNYQRVGQQCYKQFNLRIFTCVRSAPVGHRKRTKAIKRIDIAKTLAPILRRIKPALPCLGATGEPSKPPTTVKITATTITKLRILRTYGNLPNASWTLLKTIT